MHSGLLYRSVLCVVLGVFLLSTSSVKRAAAGGPLLVGGPNLGTEGASIVWDTFVPIPYRIDGGPLSTTPSGEIVIGATDVPDRIQAMFDVWQNVPTATISYTNAGPLLSTGIFIDGDVNTVEEFSDVTASCDDATQSPIILDANGSIFDALLGDPNVIGFAGVCAVDPATGKITSGEAVLNGRFQDGIEDFDVVPTNFELTASEFDEAFAHEFGHFSGLDHSQINVNVLDQALGACAVDDLAGLPLMFPFAFCQARVAAGLSPLAADDVAWISKLYPDPSFSSDHGMISGIILFSDSVTHAQGVNVIARQIDDPMTAVNESRRVAISAVSGYLFTGNPGQSVTSDYLPCDPPSACPGGFAGNNSGGSSLGSRDPLLIGFYEIPVPPGTYVLEVESIPEFFAGGSSVGPLNPPIPNPGKDEKWNLTESSEDLPTDSNPIVVAAGALVPDINIILNETGPRFDAFEGSQISRMWRLRKLALRIWQERFALLSENP